MVRPNNTKELLEIKALQFFAENDYEHASLNDIARALGVTKGAIYHYFTGKDDLFKASVTRLLDVMEEWFGTSLPDDYPLKTLLEELFKIEETLKNMSVSTSLGPAVTEYTNTMYLFLTVLKKFPELTERLDGIYVKFRKNLENLLAAAAARGDIRTDTDFEAVAYEITAFYEGALLLGGFSQKKEYADLAPRVFKAMWKRIAVENPKE